MIIHNLKTQIVAVTGQVGITANLMILNFPQKKINLKDLFRSAKSANNSLNSRVDVDMAIILCLDRLLLSVHRDKCTVHIEKCMGFFFFFIIRKLT